MQRLGMRNALSPILRTPFASCRLASCRLRLATIIQDRAVSHPLKFVSSPHMFDYALLTMIACVAVLIFRFRTSGQSSDNISRIAADEWYFLSGCPKPSEAQDIQQSRSHQSGHPPHNNQDFPHAPPAGVQTTS